MNNLIEVKIENVEGKLYVSSRDIADGLNKEHKNVIRDIDKILKSDSSNLSSEIIPSTYINSRGKEYREYLLTKDGFTLYMFNIQGYNDFKMAYINKFNEMENYIKNKEIESYRISDPIERAKRWIEEETVRLEQAKIIEEQKPKVEYHDNVLNPKRLMNITDIAKDLGMSGKELNETLNKKGIIFKKTGIWKPYAKYKWLIPEYADYKIDGYGQRLRWTEKGRQWIISLLKEESMAS